jgi:dolichol-phosphate mannosyltransferase
MAEATEKACLDTKSDVTQTESSRLLDRVMSPGLSVVIPFHNESESIPALIEEVYAALANHPSFELICVDDGSSDDTFGQLSALRSAHPDLQLVRHRNQCGQSTAVRTGVKRATAPWVATLDGDGQNDPADIPLLLDVLEDPDRPADVHLVIGMRKKRQDNLIKRVSSRIANGVRARMLGDDTPDSGCGLKLFSRDAFLDLPYFDHMHRFLPALIQRDGGRVVSVPVSHRPREKGRSHYGVLDRLGAGIVDLLGTLWLKRRARRPVIDDPNGGVEEERGP